MKHLKKFLILFILFILYVYTANIMLLPNDMVVIEGENVNLFTLWGVELKGDNKSTQASSNFSKSINSIEEKKVGVRVLGLEIPKHINVDVVKNKKVVPLGNAIGLKLYTSGVLVVGMSEIEGKKPYENTGIEMGDRILQINNEKVDSTQELVETVNKSKGKEIVVGYIKADNKTEMHTSISPVKTSDNEYKLGLWVRDAAAGIGTATFYEPETGNFACLGHGITDIDTGGLITIANGELVTTKIVTIKKGEKGRAGELGGSIDGSSKIGDIYKNTNYGIYGKIKNKQYLNITSEAIEIIPRSEIKEGKAQIICEVETGKQEYYDIEIKKAYRSNYQDNKSMLIEIKDKRLIEKTGGIVCGMSGSPIIQNGKFVGAVTNVLVNNPEVGYAVFADMMLSQMEN